MGVHRSLKSSSKLFPPGFRFHPTDEELVLYYLKGKICRRRLKPDLIAEADVYKWDPDELPGLSKLKTGDRQWFFLSPRDRKYPNGGRSNRATMRGYWKATGKDRTISCNSRSVGLKKTLVYYKGRAPSGERTDWVMHEYTLDEEELKRCPSAKDYYVLYKVYKKSGPGPKNGEQYGAPFKEEDWADDECVSFSGLFDQENIVKEADISCIDNNRTNSLPQDQVNDIDEFLKKIADEGIFDSPPAIAYSNAFDQVNTGKEIDSTLVSLCSGEVSLHDRSMLPHQYPYSNVQANFDHTQTTSYQLPIEASEIVAPAKSCQQGLVEIFCDDFLEMDDLLGPELGVQNSERAIDTLSSHRTDESAETDLYNDLAMILDGIGEDGPGEISQPYVGDNPVSGMSDVTSLPYINTIENETANYHVQPFHNEAYLMSSQLWQPEQRCNLFTPEANQAVVSEPINGVLCNEENARLHNGDTQNQSYTVDNGTDSWLSAALWSFIESIPTTPASAAENALVNKAFERMSSFGRLKPITVAGNPTTSTTHRRLQNFMGGMFSFSVIGIVCAILWVLISISVKLLGRYISS